MRVESINFLGSIEDIDDIFEYNRALAVSLENGQILETFLTICQLLEISCLNLVLRFSNLV